jgi:hypothetical protein
MDYENRRRFDQAGACEREVKLVRHKHGLYVQFTDKSGDEYVDYFINFPHEEQAIELCQLLNKACINVYRISKDESLGEEDDEVACKFCGSTNTFLMETDTWADKYYCQDCTDSFWHEEKKEVEA